MEPFNTRNSDGSYAHSDAGAGTADADGCMMSMLTVVVMAVVAMLSILIIW